MELSERIEDQIVDVARATIQQVVDVLNLAVEKNFFVLQEVQRLTVDFTEEPDAPDDFKRTLTDTRKEFRLVAAKTLGTKFNSLCIKFPPAKKIDDRKNFTAAEKFFKRRVRCSSEFSCRIEACRTGRR